MNILLKPPSKLEKLTNIYTQLILEFRKIDNSKLKEHLDAWDNALSQFDSILSQNNIPVKRSAIATGIEQGLRETPLLLQSILPEEQRSSALIKFKHIVELNIPNFFDKEIKRLNKIVTCGKIKNENEWYMIRHRIDLIEGNASMTAELNLLYVLLDTYERATAK